MVRSIVARVVTLLTLLAVSAGCGSAPTGGDPWAGAEGPQVAATVPPIVDLVERVAGERAAVVGLVPSGQDSHTYEPRPGDARTLSLADVFFVPAWDATPAVSQLARDNLREDAELVELMAAVSPSELLYTDSAEAIAAHGHGHDVNVHGWTNPRYAALFTQRIADELSERDPAGAESYAANAEALVHELRSLDDAIREALATVPDGQRRLVVYHDSWSYFAREYDMEVVGTIQAADMAEPSAAEVGAMVQQIRDAQVPVFFGSEVFPSDVLEAISRESGADYAGELSDDRLPGAAGDSEHSYVGMMLANARLMVDALGGDPSALEQADLGAGASESASG